MLKLIDANPIGSDASWTIECPVPGVVIINVTVGRSLTPVPLHWRAGTWEKPPLDVFLNEEGQLVGMQFVIQDEHLELGFGEMPVKAKTGAPRFDVSFWPTDRYKDETISVSAKRVPGGELVLHIGDKEPIRQSYETSPGFVLSFGRSDQLMRIQIGPLTSDDWADIDSFSLGT